MFLLFFKQLLMNLVFFSRDGNITIHVENLKIVILRKSFVNEWNVLLNPSGAFQCPKSLSDLAAALFPR